jgi:hypothetical protein
VRDETWHLLEKYHVAYVIVDEPLLPPDVHYTADFAYFRWHGRGVRPWFNYRYDTKELTPWIPKVKAAAEKVKTVYGYFNNHYHGYAVENCLRVLEMLGTLTPKQVEAKKRVEGYLETTAFKESGLESFVDSSQLDFDGLLKAFLDVGRLKRAEEIRDNELTILKETDQWIEASVRDYHIIIDLEARTIMHDCADWSKALQTKRFCKHIGKLLLSMDRGKATKMLHRIYSQKEEWQFKPYT